MARLIVAIDIPEVSKEELQYEQAICKKYSDWFPTKDPNVISLDNGYLTVDPDEDSFYLFKLLDIEA